LADAGIQATTGITNGTDKLSKGVELAKDGFDILKDKIKQSADEGTRYKEMTIAMELAQIRLATAIAISNRDMKEAMLISSDVTKTDEERIVALEKAIKLSNTKAAQEKELVSAELALAQLKTQQNDTDRVALLEIANLKAKLIDLDAEAFAEQRRINTQLSAFKAEIIKNEEDRIEALKEIIGLEDEKLQKEYQSSLVSLGLSKDETEMTELELEAKKRLQEQYFQDVSDARLKAIEDDIEKSNEASGKDLNILELTYLKKMNLAKGNIEAQKALTAKFDADKLAEMQRAVEAEMQIINNEIDNLSASVTFPDLASALLSEQALDDLKARLVEAGIALEQLGLSVDDVVTPKEGARSIGDSLGMSEEQVAVAKATYSSAMDAISATLDIANQVMQQKTTERIDAIQSSLESGVINEEQAEQQTQAVRKEAFEKNKKMQQAQAAISFASGLVAMWANAMTLPFPVNFIVGGSQSAF